MMIPCLCGRTQAGRKGKTMSLIIEAFTLASTIHASQVRKAGIVPNVPYMSHLMEVAGMVQAHGGDENTVAAALLHDALEDTDIDPNDIGRETNFRVLALVRECTEAGTEGSNGQFKAPWKGRKEAYLNHLAHVSPQALLISVADKLQSLREVRRQVRIQGDGAYEAFAKRDFSTIAERELAVLWFHGELAKAFQARIEALKEAVEIDPSSAAKVARLIPGVQALVDDFREILQVISKPLKIADAALCSCGSELCEGCDIRHNPECASHEVCDAY